MKKTYRTIDLTNHLKTRFAPYPRKVGRYSVSDLWAITSRTREGKRYKTAEEWLYQPEPDLPGMLRMMSGIINHNLIQEMLPKKNCEVKRVYEYQGIEIVAKADYLPDDFPSEVWEFKTKDEVMDESKPWQVHQARCYTTMFERDFACVMQPIVKDGTVVLRELSRHKRNDEWFHKQLDELLTFHEEVLELIHNQPLTKVAGAIA